MSARQDGAHGASAAAILEVAEGLRWRDPQLSAALAEHAVRLAVGDPATRGAAERTAILALGQLDRTPDVVARALPHLREAERSGRPADAASLRCELAGAAVRCGDADLAEALLGPVAGGEVLPAPVRLDALTAWAGARALRGDVEGADAAAEQAEGLLGAGAELDVLRRVDLARVRASARRTRGDAVAALEVLRAAPAAGGGSDGDGGRRAALLVADRVDLLLDLHRHAEARAAGAEVLGWAPEVTTALPLGRVRCALASRAHLPAGDLDQAEALARAAEQDLTARGHDAQAAEALEVLAAVAEQRGDLARTVSALRRAHALALAAHDAVTRARIALTTALAPPPVADGGAAAPASVAVPRRSRSSRRAAEEAAASALAGDAGDGGIPDTTAGATAPTAERPAGTPRHRGPDPVDPVSASTADVATGATDDPAASTPPVEPLTEEPDRAADAAADGASDAPSAPTPPVRTPRRGRYREDAAPSGPLAASLVDGGDAFSTAPSAPVREDGAVGAVGAAPDGSTGSHDPLDGTHESADDRRTRRARERWESAVSLLPPREPVGHGPLDDGVGSDRSGTNGVGSADVLDGPAGPADTGPEDVGGRRNGAGAAESPRSVLAAPAVGRSEPGVGTSHAPGGPPGDDDELAQELALTLVDLLAEYGGPAGVATGGGAAAWPTASDVGSDPTGLVPARPAGGSAARSGNGHRTGADPLGPSPRPPSAEPRTSTGDQVPGGSVPPARRGDDSGAKLADLLAEAMDAFRRTGQDPAAPASPPPADGAPRARR